MWRINCRTSCRLRDDKWKLKNIIYSIFAAMSVSSMSMAADTTYNEVASRGQLISNRIISEARISGNEVAAKAAQALIVSITNAGQLHGESTPSTDGNHDVLNTIANAEDELSVAQTSDDMVQAVTKKLTAMNSAIDFGEGAASIWKIETHLGGQQNPGSIQIEGIGLKKSNPLLTINGKEYAATDVSDTKVTFLVSDLVQQAQPELVRGSVTITVKRSFLSALDRKVSYELQALLLSRFLGSLTITPKIASVEKKPVSTQLFRCESPRGGAANVPIRVNASPGWLIEVPSIHYSRSYSNHGLSRLGGASPDGFTAMLECSAWGTNIVDQGSLGVEEGYFSYVETRPSLIVLTENSVVRPIYEGTVFTVADFPLQTNSLVFEYRSVQGTIVRSEDLLNAQPIEAAFSLRDRTATIHIERDVERPGAIK